MDGREGEEVKQRNKVGWLREIKEELRRGKRWLNPTKAAVGVSIFEEDEKLKLKRQKTGRGGCWGLNPTVVVSVNHLTPRIYYRCLSSSAGRPQEPGFNCLSSQKLYSNNNKALNLPFQRISFWVSGSEDHDRSDTRQRFLGEWKLPSRHWVHRGWHHRDDTNVICAVVK